MLALGSVATLALDTESTQIRPWSLGSLIGLTDFVMIVRKDTISSFPFYLPHLPVILQSQTHVARGFFCNLVL